LHVEEALAAIHWDYGPVQPIREPLMAELTKHSGMALGELVKCDQFCLRHVHANRGIPVVLGAGTLQVLILLDGKGRWQFGEKLCAGQVWVLPASLPIS